MVKERDAKLTKKDAHSAIFQRLSIKKDFNELVCAFICHFPDAFVKETAIFEPPGIRLKQ